MVGRILMCISLALPVCFSSGAQTTNEAVEKVLTGSDSDRDAMSSYFLTCPISEAVPQFLAAYLVGDINTQEKVLWGLTKIPKDAMVTEAFIEILMSGRETSMRGLWLLTDRTMSRTLTQKESDLIISVMRDGKQNAAGTAARVLAKLGPFDLGQAVEAIVEKYQAQIVDLDLEKVNLKGSYLTPRANFLNLYLLAFRDLGGSAQPVLKDALSKADNDDARIWLTMGLAVTGDKEAGLALTPILHDYEAGSSLRICATRCYAIALGEEARPLLMELMEDQALTDYPKGDDDTRKVVANAARDELSRLDQAAAEKVGMATP